jgi:hypothetical protein
MKLTDALFTLNGCFVSIAGMRAEVSSKWTLLEAGLCNVAAVDPINAGKLEALNDTPFADTGVMVCNEPQLVELAARHWTWLNDDQAAPWDDLKTETLPVQEARAALMTWLATQTSIPA